MKPPSESSFFVPNVKNRQYECQVNLLSSLESTECFELMYRLMCVCSRSPVGMRPFAHFVSACECNALIVKTTDSGVLF